MFIELRQLAIVTALCAPPVALHAQFDFNLAGQQVRVHNAASQASAYELQQLLEYRSGQFAMTGETSRINWAVITLGGALDFSRPNFQNAASKRGPFFHSLPELCTFIVDEMFERWLLDTATEHKERLS